MILVTGATGLVGQHLIASLVERGLPVRALYHDTEPVFESPLVVWVRGSILSIPDLENAFNGVDQVYHCAAIVSYDPRMKDKMMEINVEGTANVVNCCLSSNIKKLVYISSISSIVNDFGDEEIDEKSVWSDEVKPGNYALSKRKAELEIWRGISEGLRAVIVNPGIILGEGDWNKSSTNLFRIVYDEFPWYTGGSTAWVDVKDVVRAMFLLMESHVVSERFILNAGNFSYREIFNIMAKELGKKPPHRSASPWMSEFVWRLSYLKSVISGKPATISRETARAAHRKSRFSSHKFQQFFADFKYLPITETISRIATKGFTDATHPS